LLLGGDFFTGSVLAATLTKLILRLSSSDSSDSATLNSLKAEAILIMTSIIRVGQSKFAAVAIDEDSQERIMNCIETLAELGGEQVMKEVFLEDTKAAYTKMLASAEVSPELYVEKGMLTMGRRRQLRNVQRNQKFPKFRQTI
jgi:coatomer subunit beta